MDGSPVAKDAARQLCLIDQEMFKEMTSKELLSRARVEMTDSCEGEKSKLQAWSHRFNTVSLWCATMIVVQEDFPSRVYVTKQFVKLAWVSGLPCTY